MKGKDTIQLPSETLKVVRKNQTVAEVYYQFIFCARYRRKIFSEFEPDRIEDRFKQVLKQVEEELGLEIKQCVCQEDRVYLDLKAPPLFSPADIMAKIKTRTSRELRSHIKGLCHLQGLWTRAYFVTTETVLDPEKVESFLAQQKTRS